MRYNRYTPIGFAEVAFQWKTLLKLKTNGFNDLQIVAVTPEVDYLAGASGELYLSIEDFYTWDQINTLGEENIDIAEDLCKNVDDIVLNIISGFPGIDLVSSRALFHPLKGFLDSLAMRMFPLEAVFKHIQPATVLCFHQNEYKISGANLLDKPSLSLTSRLVPIVAGSTNCEIKWLDEQHSDHHNNCPRNVMDIDVTYLKTELDKKIHLLKQAINNYQPVSAFKTNQRLLFSHTGLDNFNEKIIANWKTFPQADCVDIGNLCVGIPQINNQHVKQVFSEIGMLFWKRIDEDSRIRRLFVIRGKNIYSLIRPLLYLLISKELPRLFSVAPFVEANVSTLKKAVVMTGGMMDQNSVIAKACNKYSVPMASTHRGGYLGYCYTPFHERYEMADADYYLCGGPGATETFSKPAPGSHWRGDRKRAKPVTLGLSWLEELVEEYRTPKTTNMTAPPAGPDKRKTIMYIMSAMLGDNCYIGHIFHPEIWLWRFQAELISFLSKHPDIDVILKPPVLNRYPQITNPVFDWLKQQDFLNTTVFSEDIRLENILDMADAFVIDSPSTPVWPLTCTDKPFLAYIEKSFFKLVPKAAELLAKRAILADTKNEFFRKLEVFLCSPRWQLNKPINDEFLCHYGTYLNDGNSGRRVAEFLFKLVD